MVAEDLGDLGDLGAAALPTAELEEDGEGEGEYLHVSLASVGTIVDDSVSSDFDSDLDVSVDDGKEEFVTFATTQMETNKVKRKGYEYFFAYKRKDGTQVWRCAKYQKVKCRANIVIDPESKRLVRRPLKRHRHGANFPRQAAMDLKSKVVKECLVDSAHPSAVINRCIFQSGYPTKYAAAMTRQDHMARTVQRHRKDKHAKNIPKDMQFDEFPAEFKDLVIYDSGPGPSRIIAFSNTDNLVALRDSKLLFADGTFKCRPKLYDKGQLYGIHGKVGKASYPCLVFALLPDKSERTYRRLLRALKSLPELSLRKRPWAPEHIIIDFELSSHRAFAKAFPLARITGCYFHFKQALLRKLKKVELYGLLEENREFDTLFNMLGSLAMVPPEEVERLFDAVSRRLEDLEVYVTEEFYEAKIDEYLEYFEKTWVRKARNKAPRFQVHMWNQYQNALEMGPRTNNACEGTQVVNCFASQFF